MASTAWGGLRSWDLWMETYISFPILPAVKKTWGPVSIHTLSCSCENAWGWQPVWNVVFSLAATREGMKCLCGGVPGPPWKKLHCSVGVRSPGSMPSQGWASAGWGSTERGLRGDKEYAFYHEPHGSPQILRKTVLVRKVVSGTGWFKQSVGSTVVKSSNNCPHMKLYPRERRLDFDRFLEASVSYMLIFHSICHHCTCYY